MSHNKRAYTIKQCEKLIKKYDEDGDGVISFSEFKIFCIDQWSSTSTSGSVLGFKRRQTVKAEEAEKNRREEEDLDKVLKKAFEEQDADKSGFIDPSELHAAFAKTKAESIYSLSDCKDLVRIFDNSQDQKGLDFADFKTLVQMELRGGPDSRAETWIKSLGHKASRLRKGVGTRQVFHPTKAAASQLASHYNTRLYGSRGAAAKSQWEYGWGRHKSYELETSIPYGSGLGEWTTPRAHKEAGSVSEVAEFKPTAWTRRRAVDASQRRSANAAKCAVGEMAASVTGTGRTAYGSAVLNPPKSDKDMVVADPWSSDGIFTGGKALGPPGAPGSCAREGDDDATRKYDALDDLARTEAYETGWWSGDVVTTYERMTLSSKHPEMLYGPLTLPVGKAEERRVYIKNKFLGLYLQEFMGGDGASMMDYSAFKSHLKGLDPCGPLSKAVVERWRTQGGYAGHLSRKGKAKSMNMRGRRMGKAERMDEKIRQDARRKEEEIEQERREREEEKRGTIRKWRKRAGAAGCAVVGVFLYAWVFCEEFEIDVVEEIREAGVAI